MARGGQEINSGDESTNLQAGRDVIYHNSSWPEMKEIALAVFKENFLELRGIAEDVAFARADRITNDFLDTLRERRPELAGSFKDPDMQRSLFTAQREFACSGEDDLGQVLVDLLVDRAAHDGRSLQTLVLNEAINAAPKLTEAERRAIANIFVTKYTRYNGPLDLDQYYDGYVGLSLSPFAEGLPRKRSEYQHIEYVGVGSISIGTLSLGQAIINGQEGFFTNGFASADIPEEILALQLPTQLFRPCLRDTSKMQVAIGGLEDVSKFLEPLGLPQHEQAVKNLMSRNAMGPEEVIAEVVGRVPNMQSMTDAWSNSELPKVTLTSVGLALGHAYWKRTTGLSADLSIWV